MGKMINNSFLVYVFPKDNKKKETTKQNSTV